MANDQNLQSQADAPHADGAEIDRTFGLPVEEKPIWVDLYASLRDLFFPPKLPPLELTSTPIPVPDRMAMKANPWAIGISTVFNVSVVAVLLFLGVKTYIENKAKPQTMLVTPLDEKVPKYKAPKADVQNGGGGGSPDKMEANQGRIPPRMKMPDMTAKIDQPPLPSIDVQKDIVIPDNPSMTLFGVSKSANVKLASGGNGSGMGLGNGHGNGYGSGSGGGIGGGVFRIGGDVSAPKILFAPEAEFSDEARRAKYQGEVELEIIVDAQGNPQNARVVRSLGMGLDEKAIEAVMKYKFKPAMKNGKPVAVWQPIAIDFHLY